MENSCRSSGTFPGYTTMTAAYDHKNQRIYTDMPGPYPWNGQKFYCWNQSCHIIGEGKVNKTITFKYTQMSESRNSRITQMHTETDLKYQVSNTVSFRGFRALRDSDNINNAQGTPILIIDEQNNPVSKINLDEWGNIGDKTSGPQQEINFTGKKLDVPTGLYYFNQRYYDPEIGRFINEDPAGQGLNPYAYCGNNPLMYTDPNGEFFGLDDLFMAVALTAIKGAAISAAVNASVQYAVTNHVNWDSVGQAAMGGAVGGVMFNSIGAVADKLGSGFEVGSVGRAALHGVGGGLTSQMMGGDFNSGLVGSSVAELAAPGIMGATSDFAGRFAGSALVGGLASWTTGGSFYNGAMSGGFGMAFNEGGGALETWLRKAFYSDYGMSPEQAGNKVENCAKNKAIDTANFGIDTVNNVGPVNVLMGLGVASVAVTQQYEFLPAMWKLYDYLEPLNNVPNAYPIPYIRK